MIVQENMEINNRLYVKTYSDSNKYVVRDGVSYEVAIDLSKFNRVYIEGDTIPNNEMEVLSNE